MKAILSNDRPSKFHGKNLPLRTTFGDIKTMSMELIVNYSSLNWLSKKSEKGKDFLRQPISGEILHKLLRLR